MKTFASLFSGGCLADVGAMQAGLVPLWGIEAVDEIAAVARQNGFADVQTALVQQVKPEAFAPPDILWASPPCQSYSQAKHNGAETDDDIELAGYIARFLMALRPAAFVLENVRLYARSQALLRIEQALTALGYQWQAGIVNAADFGVPQTRQRFILRATLGRPVPPLVPTHSPFGTLFTARWRGWFETVADLVPTFPKSAFAPWQAKRLEQMPRYASVLVSPWNRRGFAAPENEPAMTVCVGNGSTPRALLVEGTCSTSEVYQPPVRSDEEPSMTVRAMMHKGMPRAFLIDCQNSGRPALCQGELRGLTIRDKDDPAFTILASSSKGSARAWLDSGTCVQLTTRAIARLQTIPDEYILPNTKTLAMTVGGNAVPPLLAQRIAESLF